MFIFSISHFHVHAEGSFSKLTIFQNRLNIKIFNNNRKLASSVGSKELKKNPVLNLILDT